MSGAGSFLEGMAGGMGMGLKAKQYQQNKELLNAMKDTSQAQAPTGTQAVQATAQNGANAATGAASVPVASVTEQAGMGLPEANTMWSKTGSQQSGKPDKPLSGLLSNIMDTIGNLGG